MEVSISSSGDLIFTVRTFNIVLARAFCSWGGQIPPPSTRVLQLGRSDPQATHSAELRTGVSLVESGLQFQSP